MYLNLPQSDEDFEQNWRGIGLIFLEFLCVQVIENTIFYEIGEDDKYHKMLKGNRVLLS